MSIEDLLRGPIRFSNLKSMSLSPAHYLERITGASSKSRPLTVGTLTHTMLLGGGKLPVVYPGKMRRGKAWEEFEAANVDSHIVSQSEYDAAMRCVDAVQAHDDAMSLLTGAMEVELPLWRYAGRSCGGRVDVVSGQHIVELKTSSTSEPVRFSNQALRLAYHAQLDWYLHGNRESGGTATDAYIVAVETSPPHPVTVMTVTPRALEAGRRLWVMWIERLLTCESAGVWPGYSQARVPLDVADRTTFTDELFDDEVEA